MKAMDGNDEESVLSWASRQRARWWARHASHALRSPHKAPPPKDMAPLNSVTLGHGPLGDRTHIQTIASRNWRLLFLLMFGYEVLLKMVHVLKACPHLVDLITESSLDCAGPDLFSGWIHWWICSWIGSWEVIKQWKVGTDKRKWDIHLGHAFEEYIWSQFLSLLLSLP
jgi:hypothetical protein